MILFLQAMIRVQVCQGNVRFSCVRCGLLNDMSSDASFGCYSGSASTSVQLYETDEDEEPSGVSRTRFNHTPGRVPGLPTYQDSSR